MKRESTKLPVHNIPIRTKIGREIKNAFLPPPDSVFMNIDFSAAELRILVNLMCETQDEEECEPIT